MDASGSRQPPRGPHVDDDAHAAQQRCAAPARRHAGACDRSTHCRARLASRSPRTRARARTVAARGLHPVTRRRGGVRPPRALHLAPRRHDGHATRDLRPHATPRGPTARPAAEVPLDAAGRPVRAHLGRSRAHSQCCELRGGPVARGAAALRRLLRWPCRVRRTNDSHDLPENFFSPTCTHTTPPSWCAAC